MTTTEQHPEGFTHRNSSGNRVTYRPDWSKVKPWISYRRGTAGLSFATEDQALAWLEHNA